MKLTEIKLKEMIMEALEQESESAENRGVLTSMLAHHGFEPYDANMPWVKLPTKHANYSSRSWFKGQPGRRGTVKFTLTYNLVDSILHYKMEGLSRRKRRRGTTFSIASGKIEMPPSLSLETEEGIEQADAIMLSSANTFSSKDPNHKNLTIKDTIERALEMYE